ncbi:hypothetical protein [Leeuwenhoekiella marinoflava]|uniref:Uncharacterized protein n=2 Tax=Leeuwenhoekiella marinoflava TaxID=988 RepID=A0A4Q0PKE3_9FLAO|nr:hypothetical protein [Leeuwenhoekiella marinoflava]RXG27574.1 hypothetical protein DSL99_2797 [Leeuwenhoekiella marinoflava]SHF66040.1 hypothetical protein SAMN02745246_03090 [Leeuwenhoekiella marinoflava DSM 3653]
MLQLQITNIDDYKILTERVKELLIPSEVLVVSALSKPTLIDGEHTTEGLEAINKYLDDLEKFTKQWYACRCDMFP